jgi:uncharacterized protein YhhL (DUF1145 family)
MYHETDQVGSSPNVSDLIFVMCHPTQQFSNKQISTALLVFVYCVEILLYISALSGHYQEVITRIRHSLLGCLQIWVQVDDLYIFRLVCL